MHLSTTLFRSLNAMVNRLAVLLVFLLTTGMGNAQSTASKGMPQLVKNGKATQLMVDGKPFLIVGGELNNSSSSSMAYMKPLWQPAKDLHFIIEIFSSYNGSSTSI